MSDTTTTPIAAFDPVNRFVTFEGLKDYDANLISNLHSLGYNNKVSGANIFAWGNNNQIDGQNLFVFGNGFNLTSNQKYSSLFLGNGYALGEWKGAEDTVFGVWGPPSEGVGKPIFRVGVESIESEEPITAAFSIRSDGSFSAANGGFNIDSDNFVIKYTGWNVSTGSVTPFQIYNNNQNKIAFMISQNGTITTLNYKTVQWLPIEKDTRTYYCLCLTEEPS